MSINTDKTLMDLEKMMGRKSTFGSMLRSIRQCEAMTQKEFACLLGISSQKLCDLEHGRCFVSAKTAEDFANRLGDSPEYFVVRCLQDELDRSEINMRLVMRNEVRGGRVAERSG